MVRPGLTRFSNQRSTRRSPGFAGHLPFEATPGKVKMKMRATDGTGAVMDEKERSPLPDGATGWPRRSFTVKE